LASDWHEFLQQVLPLNQHQIPQIFPVITKNVERHESGLSPPEQQNQPARHTHCLRIRSRVNIVGQTFDAVLSIGLMFLSEDGSATLLNPEIQGDLGAGRPFAIHLNRQTRCVE